MTIKDILTLTKFHLSLTVSISCAFGYILGNSNLDINILYPFFAVLFLSFGVCSLNQIQEYKKDSLMQRTQDRPIPSGRISYINACLISGFFILLSLFLIYIIQGLWGIILFIVVIILYNLLYTNAKKYTIYAGVYGSILGVIPPYIGWISNDISIYNIQFFALALFFFVWQIPHFWLLNLEYHKDYEDAGFPTITQQFGRKSLEKITFIWLNLTLLCGIFLVMTFNVDSLFILTLIIILHIYILYTIFRLLKYKKYIYNFININIYMLFLMIIMCINSIFYIN
jgi:heme o synthase